MGTQEVKHFLASDGQLIGVVTAGCRKLLSQGLECVTRPAQPPGDPPTLRPRAPGGLQGPQRYPPVLRVGTGVLKVTPLRLLSDLLLSPESQTLHLHFLLPIKGGLEVRCTVVFLGYITQHPLSSPAL